jgi:hypothetical protein
MSDTDIDIDTDHVPNSKKRTLPYELRSEIMQYTNKRTCIELGYSFEHSKIEQEFNKSQELYAWPLITNPLLKLEFMKNASILVEKNVHKYERNLLKKDIKLVVPPIDKHDRLYYNKVYTQCMKTTTGCDICNTFGTIIRCTECNIECHSHCGDFIECSGCEKQHCLYCIKTCSECQGTFCNSMIHINHNSPLYYSMYICTACAIHCVECNAYYLHTDSKMCLDCGADVCGCRTCYSCYTPVCNNVGQCAVCLEDLCDECSKGTRVIDGCIICIHCEYLVWTCDDCNTTNTTNVCTTCFDTEINTDIDTDIDTT